MGDAEWQSSGNKGVIFITLNIATAGLLLEAGPRDHYVHGLLVSSVVFLNRETKDMQDLEKLHRVVYKCYSPSLVINCTKHKNDKVQLLHGTKPGYLSSNTKIETPLPKRNNYSSPPFSTINSSSS